ncbi:acyltransferase [Tolypothrix sp. FACHB-123]|uniref:acyltransferase family protein n=1 Tax=Tolypothrix sp. FACHB-123 TaxID=2692868 RepID=UPI001687AA38|nr:acyltransferase [Tolypothrix sp. FACHB-123]MBD2357542.1 acyltransferase [Tolypothrix sp. FACHB-123]
MYSSIHSESSSKARYTFDWNLEGLRGFAALAVGYSHVFGFNNFLDPSYQPSAYLKNLWAGHAAVLIFFMLSGYLIGLTNTAKFSLQNAKLYLIRRGIRLIPIYWFAICFSIVVLPTKSLINILGNLLFLQNLLVSPLQGNTIIWTLNYEIVYYLLFLLIWCFKPKLAPLLLGCLIISSIGWLIPQTPQLWSSYAAGWIFWLIGLGFAWKVQCIQTNSQKIPLFSYLLLLTATNFFSTGKVFLNSLGFSNPSAAIVNLSDLALLPICVLIFAEVTHRQLRYLIMATVNLLCYPVNEYCSLNAYRSFV